jgi:hypothetical protein
LPLPPDFTSPTNDLHELLIALATRIGAVRTGGEPDLEAAQRFFLRAFQEGKFGAWTLDNLLAEEQIPEEGETIPTIIKPPPASEITGLVSARVRNFLDEQSREQARRSEGIAESATQEKKQERAKTTAERTAKWEAKLARRAAAGGPGKGRLTRSTPQARRR